jgi:hypothetical protein
MKHVRAALVLASLVAVAGAAGCNEGPPPAGRADRLSPEQYPRAVALERLDRVLRFGPPIVDRSEEGRPMRVSQPVRNLDRRELNVQYRFEFQDESGRPLKTNSGWAYKTLTGSRVETMLEATALEDTAADWRLEVRPAR